MSSSRDVGAGCFPRSMGASGHAACALGGAKVSTLQTTNPQTVVREARPEVVLHFTDSGYIAFMVDLNGTLVGFLRQFGRRRELLLTYCAPQRMVRRLLLDFRLNTLTVWSRI